MNEPQYHLPPKLLLHSFVLVTGGYLASMALLLAAGLALILLFFPETSSAIGADPAEFNVMLEHQAAELFPMTLMLPLSLVGAVSSFGIGFMLARLAPFAKFGHTLFLAAILFVSLLQSAIGAPAALQGKLLMVMVFSSASVLLGARVYLKGLGLGLGSEPGR